MHMMLKNLQCYLINSKTKKSNTREVEKSIMGLCWDHNQTYEQWKSQQIETEAFLDVYQTVSNVRKYAKFGVFNVQITPLSHFDFRNFR